MTRNYSKYLTQTWLIVSKTVITQITQTELREG